MRGTLTATAAEYCTICFQRKILNSQNNATGHSGNTRSSLHWAIYKTDRAAGKTS